MSAEKGLRILVRGRSIGRSPGKVTEHLSPDSLEKALANLRVAYAERQLELLREGLPQPWPKKVFLRRG